LFFAISLFEELPEEERDWKTIFIGGILVEIHGKFPGRISRRRGICGSKAARKRFA
jgi:hypothetical protein